LRDRPDLWLPDNLLLLQEYLPVDPARRIVRMELVGGALRSVSELTHFERPAGVNRQALEDLSLQFFVIVV
jgi:hypothetical protein